MATQIEIPKLKKNEIYAGAIIDSNGKGKHIILLPDEKEERNWLDMMAWADALGGSLPDRAEFLLLEKLSEQFYAAGYWSREQTTDYEGCAWFHTINPSSQSYSSLMTFLRGRAIRHVEI